MLNFNFFIYIEIVEKQIFQKQKSTKRRLIVLKLCAMKGICLVSPMVRLGYYLSRYPIIPIFLLYIMIIIRSRQKKTSLWMCRLQIQNAQKVRFEKTFKTPHGRVRLLLQLLWKEFFWQIQLGETHKCQSHQNTAIFLYNGICLFFSVICICIILFLFLMSTIHRLNQISRQSIMRTLFALQCTYTTYLFDSLKRHHKVKHGDHTESKYMCSVCYHVSATKQDMTIHSYSHDQTKPYMWVLL